MENNNTFATLFEGKDTQLTEAGDSYTHSVEKYSYREGDDLPFATDTFADDGEYVRLPVIPKTAPKPLKRFKIKFVWTFREGERNWQEHALDVVAKSVKQACFKVHEMLRKKEHVCYKITNTWEMNFLPGNNKVYDLKPVKA